MKRKTYSTKTRLDEVYSERNQCVALLAALAMTHGWSVGVLIDAQEQVMLLVDSPLGQVSWHFPDSERYLLTGFPLYHGRYDGHSIEEKYQRVRHSTYMLTGPIDRQRFTPEQMTAHLLICLQVEETSKK